jgi:hypothetical protein
MARMMSELIEQCVAAGVGSADNDAHEEPAMRPVMRRLVAALKITGALCHVGTVYSAEDFDCACPRYGGVYVLGGVRVASEVEIPDGIWA